MADDAWRDISNNVRSFCNCIIKATGSGESNRAGIPFIEHRQRMRVFKLTIGWSLIRIKKKTIVEILVIISVFAAIKLCPR